MASLMNERAAPRLERSCVPAAVDWMRIAPSARGLERLEAFFSGHGFDPHRHDTYAIGFTTQGVQCFRYRGASATSVPGQVFVLHPDETHDGHAGTSAGFRYRILYLDPGAVREALGEMARLPFVGEVVSSNSQLAAAIRPALEDLDRPLEDLHRDQIILGLADALAAADSAVVRRGLGARNWPAVRRARDLLEAAFYKGVSSAELEAATGLTRYVLARHFRLCLGTSPYRYLLMRRLDRARALIRRGTPLAEAAVASGFADQSHMTRHFRKAHGLSPGRWAAVTVSRNS
jgi:AraC-like DNA-binding protein/quercetin dioxygenase-like cupin family protein